jgi:hypothetical protein
MGPAEALSLCMITGLSAPDTGSSLWVMSLTWLLLSSLLTADWCCRWYTMQTGAEPMSVLPGPRTRLLGPILVIEAVTSEDAGMYRCSASNAGGEASAELRLVVATPLHVEVTPPLLSVHLGGSAEFRCIESSQQSPTPQVTWYKDGRPLPGAARSNGDRLVIPGVGREDRGMYQCVVRRPEGETAQAAAELQLGGEYMAPQGSHSSGEYVAPQGSHSSGEFVAPQGSHSSGEYLAPQGSHSSGEYVAPQGSRSGVECVAPQGSRGGGECVAPQGSRGGGECVAPQGSHSSGECVAPQGSHSSGECVATEGSRRRKGGCRVRLSWQVRCQVPEWCHK